MNIILLKNIKVLPLLFLVILFTTLSATSARAYSIDAPFNYFNVYSLGNIDYYSSDFQGTTGAAGSVNFNNFTLFNMDSHEYALHVGGTYERGAGVDKGSVEVNGNVLLKNGSTIKSDTLNTDLHTDGSVSVSGNPSVYGDVYAAGTIASPIWNGGTRNPGTPYSPVADHTTISNYFKDYSTTIGAMLDTGIVIDSFGQLILNAGSGVNVFSVTTAELLAAYGVKVTGPGDAVVYLNVTGGGAASLDYVTWDYGSFAAGAGSVLLNYTAASSLAFTNGQNVNMLAPFTDINFTNGLLTGNLIAGNLSGNGQINLGHFEHGGTTPVPEPATLLMLGIGGVVLGALRYRKRSNKVA